MKDVRKKHEKQQKKNEERLFKIQMKYDELSENLNITSNLKNTQQVIKYYK